MSTAQFTISPATVYDEILVCMQAGVTPIFTGSPGVGKSAIVKQFAEDHNLELIDVRVAQCTPEDLQGFPMRNGNKAEFVPFDIFPVEGDPLPEGKDGWLLFMDELTSANKAVQAAAYKLILDRQTGSHKLHSNVVTVAAGNKATDKAVVQQMSTALQSRLIHYEMDVDYEASLKHAIDEGWDHRVIGFLSFMPERWMQFDPNHSDKTFACPRTWEFNSRMLTNPDGTPREIEATSGARICGTIGEGVGIEFMTFAKEYDRIPKKPDILRNPMTTNVPSEISTKYATVTMLMQSTEESEVSDVLTYMDRFDLDLRIIFMRGMIVRHPTLRDKNPTFAKKVREVVKYLQ